MSFLFPSEKQDPLHINQKSSPLNYHVFNFLKTILGSLLSTFQTLWQVLLNLGQLTAPVSPLTPSPPDHSQIWLCWLKMSGMPYLGLFSLPEWISLEPSSKVTSSVKLPSPPLSASGGSLFLPPLYFKRPWLQNDSQAFTQAIPVVKILKCCHAIWQIAAVPKAPRAPVFHQPQDPPTWSSTKELLPDTVEGVLQKPLPPWSGFHPAWFLPIQDQLYNVFTILLPITLHYGQWFLGLPIQLDFEHYVLFVFAFSRA